MLSAVASGRVNQLDPADYDAIPPRGPSIGSVMDEHTDGGLALIEADDRGAVPLSASPWR